ncbi:hypothetical protein B0I08_101104 [Glaciihabitans tibetensis]|uniref:Uncharacterized protein n=2 Tax=Glaciihabitans tibetensis TaxID=1266600 RepID=A0A2T0VIE3_9MICO|nr:hypothetical protein B0I08_101104 [Glaciihabitans tibetensis]
MSSHPRAPAVTVHSVTARVVTVGATMLCVSAFAVTASGCALSAGSGDSAGAARDSLYETLDSTQDLLGGSWDNQDDPTSRGCVIPLWTDGESFPALRVGPDPARADVAVATVSAFWSDLGLELTTTDVGEVVELQGESDLGEVLILRISAEAMTLQGESECRPAA